MKKNIIITAGGTGGHIFPALAVAKILSENYNIIWVGSSSGLENQIIPKYGYSLETVAVGGIRKKKAVHKLVLPLVLLKAAGQSLSIILRHKPQAIVGFGGYAAFPICLTGRLLAKPVIIHEQNSIAGLTNRLIAKAATKVLTAFPGVLPSKKTFLVGNPVREEIINLAAEEINNPAETDKLRILIVGGSQGAKVLNEIVPAALAKIPQHIVQVLHQVGRNEIEPVEQIYKEYQINAQVVKFIDDMALAYKNADVVICRSGASTVAEIACINAAAIFVPYPYAVDDHQAANAKYLADNEAAYFILQSRLNPEMLAELLLSLSPAKCRDIAARANKFAIKDAPERICQQIEYVITK